MDRSLRAVSAAPLQGVVYRAWPYVVNWPNPRSLDWWVASHGGVVTTMLIEFLSRFGTVNQPDDSDRLKHLSRPPVKVSPSTKLVYVYGDPVLAVLSLYRRGYAHVQSRKNGNVRMAPPAATVAEYAAKGVDTLRLTAHLRAWVGFVGGNAVLVDSRRIWDVQPELMRALGIGYDDAALPPRRPRKTVVDDVGQETRLSLHRIYEPYYGIIDDLPPVSSSGGFHRG